MIKKTGVFKYIRDNIITKVFSCRMTVICLVQFFFHDSFVKYISDMAIKYKERVSPFLFPLMCSTLIFIMIFGFCVLYMYSEVPFMNQKEMYYVVRSGRYIWLLVQEFTITILALLFILYSFLLDIIRLFPHLSFADTWDRIEMSLAYGSLPTDGVAFEMDILQRYSPFQIMFYGLIMGFFVVNLVGHMMYTISLLFHRLVAVVIGSVLALMPIVTYNTSNVFWWVYYISPFSWISPSYLMRSQSIPNFIYKISACLIGTIVCIAADYLIIKKLDFDWNTEE